MPPMMPFFHDALWLGLLAGLAFLAWKATGRLDLRLPAFALRRSAPVATAGAPSTWFTTTTRSSGNSAFDDWRDGELARIEAERQALEARLAAFEAFVDKLKRAKDRETFERFMAQFREIPAAADRPADPADDAVRG